MLVVELKPALGLFTGGASARLPQDMGGRVVKRGHEIQLLEFEGFLERQADEDPSSIAVDKVASRWIAVEVSHSARAHLRSRVWCELQGVGDRSTGTVERRSRSKAERPTSPSFGSTKLTQHTGSGRW